MTPHNSPRLPFMIVALALWCTALAILALARPAFAQPLSPEALDTMPRADIVILGEVHDNPVHHINQARAVAALAPRALVWEMLTPEQAARMPQDRSDAQAVGAAIGWDDSGWPDFSLYHPILLAAPDVPVYGGGVPRGTARRVFDEAAAGVFAGLFGAEADTLGLEKPLSPEDQAAREAGQAAAHCDALPEHLLPGMVAAQRLRDAALAHVALEAWAETGGPVVVIAGTGHARVDIGIPAYLRRASAAPGVVSLGQMEEAPAENAPYDFWIVTEPTSRPDPCEGLR